MSDAAPRRLPDAAEAELSVNGRLLCLVQQRPEDDLSPLEGAALATSLRNLADHVEDATCDGRQAGEVLAEGDVAVEIHDDEPANVG